MYSWQVRRVCTLILELLPVFQCMPNVFVPVVSYRWQNYSDTHFYYSRANLDTEFLQLVCRRHQVSTKTHFADVMNPHLLTVEDLLKLQEDVASLYLGGRPKIANISSMHIPFTFKVSKHTYEAHPLKYVLLYLYILYNCGSSIEACPCLTI